MKAARRQSAATHGFGREGLGLTRETAVTPHLRDGELRIARAAGASEARAHALARRDHTLSDSARGLAAVLSKLLIRDARDMNPQIDPVEQRTRETSVVAVDRIG